MTSLNGKKRFMATQNAAGGRRADLGDRYFRSNMEANLARIWEFMRNHGELSSWEYEPLEFDLGEHRKNAYYKPDFKLRYATARNINLTFHGSIYRWVGCEYVWVEAKGFMNNDSRIKIKRFLKEYQHEPLRIIESKEYLTMMKGLSGLIEFEKK